MHKHKDTGVVVDLSSAQPAMVSAYEKAGFEVVAESVTTTKAKPKTKSANIKEKITKVAGKLTRRG